MTSLTDSAGRDADTGAEDGDRPTGQPRRRDRREPDRVRPGPWAGTAFAPAALAAVALLLEPLAWGGLSSSLSTGPGTPVTGSGAAAAQEPDWDAARRRMVRQQIEQPPGPVEPVRDTAVLRALRSVPRHQFVPPPYRALAYADRPLPIGQGQTISQPYIVARMTELLELEAGEKVLEVGTGSGYQAAVLAEITDSVFSVEIIEELARSARARLRRLGYGRVRVRHGDGYGGWPEQAPFDAIVVTAAPEEVPAPLVEQLTPGGRMVLPRGPAGRTQVLMVVEKRLDGSVATRDVSHVRFVPMQRDTAPRRP